MAKQIVSSQIQDSSHCGTTNFTINRLVTKLGDIITPKNMRNLQNANLNVGFSMEPLKRTAVSIHSLSEQIEFLNSSSSMDETEEAISCTTLAKSIETALRDAKSQGLEWGEVLVPDSLTTRVAEDVLLMSEDEPCGLRGCVIYMNYEDRNVCRRIGKVRCDPDSVATFEVTLTLRPDTTGWLRLLPLKGCWKKFRNSTLVVSSGYTLVKNKLYRSNQA